MEIIKQHIKQLSLVERVAAAIAGPILGLLPPRKQLQITQQNNNAARIMSTSSRITNGVITIYTVASLVGNAMGIDLNPTQGNTVTNVGIIVGIDTVIREVLYAGMRAFSIHQNHPDPGMSYTEVWGEPLISMLYAGLAKED